MFRLITVLVSITLNFGLAVSFVDAAEGPGELAQEFRIVWGGTNQRVYQGSFSIEEGQIKLVRNLSMQESAITALQQSDPTKINLLQSSPTTFGGMDITVRATTAARLKIQLRDAISDKVFERTVNLLDLQQKNWMETIDDSGCRIAIERQSYDRLRVETRNNSNSIFECNSIWTPIISGYRTGLPAGDYQLIGTWANRSGANVIEQPIRVDANGNFAEIRPEIRIPASESAYRLDLTIVRPNLMSAISGAKPLLNRSVDVMAFDKTQPVATVSSWHAVMAVDTAAAVKPEGLSWLTSFTGSLASRALEVPGSLHIPGLDLTEQINRLIPISKSVTNYGAIARGGQLSVRDFIVEGSPAAQRTTVIGPSSWLSLPISGLTPGKPHRLRIQVPIDYPSSLSVSVRDQVTDTDSLLDPQSCLEIKDEDCKPGGTITHDFIFWPTSDSTSLLISSASRTKSGLVGKILVEAAELVSTPKDPLSTQPRGRQIAMYLDQPLLVECFAAPREKDPINGRMYETWKTWQAVAERLVQQMQIANADTLVLSGMSGGNSIVPLKSTPQLHRLDKATFFTDSRSPEMHDFVELLLLHMDRAGYRLILETELPTVQQLPTTLGKPDELAQSDLLRGTNRESTNQQVAVARLNPLHRKVQQNLMEPIRETAQRYSQHPSFAGLSIRLNTNSQFLFAGDRWGYNDDLVKQFSADSGVHISNDAQQKLQLFSGPARFRFINWRAKQLTKFYAQIAQVLTAENPDFQLYLNVVQLLGRTPNESDFVDPDLITRNPQQLLLSYGIDLESLGGTTGISIAQGTVRHSKQLLAGAEWSRTSGVESESTDALQQAGAIFITHQPRALKLSVETDRQKGATEAWIYPDSSRIGNQAKRILLEQLWKSDPMLLGIGGWHPVWSCENEVQTLLSSFKLLPPVPMKEVKAFQSESTLKIRSGTFEGKSYLALINLSPWEMLVQIDTKGPTVDVQPLGKLDPARVQCNGNRIVLQVPPCDLIGLVSMEASSLDVVSANIQFPEGSLESTVRQIEKLGAYLAHAADPGQQQVLFGVGGTFEQWTANSKPTGWNVSTLPLTAIQQAPELPHSGSYSVLIENRNAEPATAWIQSAPIALPETGRLTLRAWLRASAADQAQPKVRLGLIGRLSNGQRYQRSIVYGGNQNDPTKSLSVDWGRRPAELHVTDIPVDDLLELQVAVDLIGPGRIWVDDVEVVQSWLHPDERNYLRGQMLVVKERLASGNPFAADRLLHSPWSEYLFELGKKMEADASGKSNVVPSGEENRADWNRSKPSIQQLRDSMRQRWIK